MDKHREEGKSRQEVRLSEEEELGRVGIMPMSELVGCVR
jgi:hypothetical protein